MPYLDGRVEPAATDGHRHAESAPAHTALGQVVVDEWIEYVLHCVFAHS